MKMIRFPFFLLALAGLVFLSACGGGEETEDAVEESAEETGSTLDEAGEHAHDAYVETKKAVEEAGEKIEESAKKAKEEAEKAVEDLQEQGEQMVEEAEAEWNRMQQGSTSYPSIEPPANTIAPEDVQGAIGEVSDAMNRARDALREGRYEEALQVVHDLGSSTVVREQYGAVKEFAGETSARVLETLLPDNTQAGQAAAALRAGDFRGGYTTLQPLIESEMNERSAAVQRALDALGEAVAPFARNQD